MDALDSWYPVVRTQRTTRSSQDGYIFAMAPMGRPIIRTTYSLADVLAVENELLIEREDTDAVYRGEKKPGGDPLGAITLQDLHDIIMSDADEGESEVSSEDVVMSDAEDVVMVDAHDGGSEASSGGTDSDIDELASSPAPPSSSTPASSPAPDDVVSSEECSTVPVPATPRRPITYSRRDRERYSARREQTFSEHVAAQEAQMLENVAAYWEAEEQAATVAEPPSPRRSPRLNHPPSTAHEELKREGVAFHPWIDDKPRAVIDPATYVLGVIVGAPKGEGEWWANIIDEGAKVLDRASRNADFHNLAEGQRRLRLGVAFGEEEAAPHGITNLEANLKEIHRMETEEPLAAIAAYQNHIYRQFAERGHAHVTSLVAELIRREIAFPSYKHSIFTTTEIQLGGDLDTFKNTNVAFNTWELLTFIGSWDSKTGGGIHFSDQEGLVEVVPGATIAFLSGAKSYTLMPIAAHETRYIVRQYVHASVLRWVQKGGRSDVEFACVASDKEVEAWDMLRVNRGRTSLRLFSKLDELYVL
ncbi:hypothetical protein C8R47DRAFT_1206908 [Mycena vitilis]|nr:hypothetical protein C8R47DRAFT_1206908 [Mycena vitilis]